jgi:hypothetical protein
MPYMVRLTGVEALKFAAVGAGCLCLVYGLGKVLKAVDQLGRNSIAYLGDIANQPNSSRAISSALGVCKKTLKVIHLLALAILVIATFLLWAGGTALIMYAAVGPLL